MNVKLVHSELKSEYTSLLDREVYRSAVERTLDRAPVCALCIICPGNVQVQLKEGIEIVGLEALPGAVVP